MTQPQQKKPWWKKRQNQWAVGIIAGLIVALLSSPLVQDLFNSGTSAAAQLRECMALHGLKKARQQSAETYDQEHARRTGEYTKTVFSSCSWPPSEITAGDGYSEIVVILAQGPGQAEASSATRVDRVKATCKTIHFAYQEATQGKFFDYKPFILSLGSVAYAGDGQATAWSGSYWDSSRSPYPESDEIVLLHDSKRRLASAQCVKP